MIKIKAEYFYYGGTFHTPKSGFLRESSFDWKGLGNDKVLEFATEKDALDFLNENVGEMELVKGKATYSQTGTYYLSHGEYSRPYYTLVKTSMKGHHTRVPMKKRVNFRRMI